MASQPIRIDQPMDLSTGDTRVASALDTHIGKRATSTLTSIPAASDEAVTPRRVRNRESDSHSTAGVDSSSITAHTTAATVPPTTAASESRLDPITGEWTIFATRRALRPDQFGATVEPEPLISDCPFCGGHESETPTAVWTGAVETPGSLHQPGSPDWSVRVVPNLYPAVMAAEDSGSLPLRGAALRGKASSRPVYQQGLAIQRGLFVHDAAVGGHEVIIESSRHTRSLSELNLAEVALVFQAYASRIRHWRSFPGIRYINVFKNVGRDAGASLQHGHSQLVATNQLPTNIDRITKRFQAHHARTGSCLQCDVVRAETNQRDRIICQTPSLVAYCPYASRFPLMVRITSPRHLPHFDQCEPELIEEISHLTMRTVRWLEGIRPGTAYNLLVYTTPPGFGGDLDSQHWAIELFPRLSRMAGYELSCNGMINPMFPESATELYRAEARKSDPRRALR